MIPAPLAVLTEARSIIANPENWFKGYFHNDDDTAFCSLGAINKAYDKLGLREPLGMHSPARRILDAAVGARYPEFIGRNMKPELFGNLDDLDGVYLAQWNDADERVHAEVIEMFDVAVLLAEAGMNPPL